MGTLTDGRTELTVPSGTHEIRVVADGYNDAVGSVEVRPGSSAEITLNPTRKDAGGAGGAGGDDPTKDSGGKTSTQKIIGYAGIGVGGAIALVGGYFWFKTATNSGEDSFDEFKKSEVGKGQDACDVAEQKGRQDIVDFCDSHGTQRTLAWVLTPIGVAIAGVGAYFLLTDDSDSREGSSAGRVQPLVGVGPNGGEVHLHVTF
jgi:hypothetical protein